MLNYLFKQSKLAIGLCALTLCIVGGFSPSSQAESGISKAKSLFFESNDEGQFLSPDEAFQLTVEAQDSDHLKANFKIEPGYYLYKQRISLTTEPTSAVKVSNLQLPAGEIKNDPNFGEQEVYHHDFSAQLTLKHSSEQPSKPLIIHARYQGCSEQGLCYAPQRKSFTVNLKQPSGDDHDVTANTTGEANDDSSEAATLLKSGKWWLIILGFFSAGLLLAFTPCVFPMIPILSSIIIGKNAHTSRWKAFNLSLAYTLGMALTYTLAGIAAGLSGQLLSNALQTPWALSAGAIIFVALALSMFGFYELKFPSAIESYFFNWSNRFKGGHLISDFLMGAISALIISPCVAAPLAGALLYISKTHDVVLGGVALFALSMGMGAPLLAIGASAGTLLPKVGVWMNAVRNLFGVLMIGVAVWLITPIIPSYLQLTLWATLLIVPSIFMHALDSLPSDASPARRFWKGIGIMMLITGIALLIGALSGAKSALQPLSGLTSSSLTTQHTSLFTRVQSETQLNQAIKAAEGKLVMLDFYADWCVSCKEYEQFVFTDPRVQQQLKHMVLLQADVTANNEQDQALLKRFNLFGPPGIIFFDANGQEIAPHIVGYKNADAFLTILKQLSTERST